MTLETRNDSLTVVTEIYAHANALKPAKNHSRKRIPWDVRFALWWGAATLFALAALAAGAVAVWRGM